MSLLDALLLDPYPFNVWIAYRTDGIKGSGTASDPYDGSPVFAVAKSITSLARTGTVATATLASGHGYVNGETVFMAGATGNDATFYNGFFTIQNVQATSFDYIMAGSPAASAVGTITATKATGIKLDGVLNAIPANTHVHLGAGTFLTAGYADGVGGGWQPKAGMKIEGSGIGVTTLKVVNASQTDKHYFAIGHALDDGGSPAQPYLKDFLEVSDLTIDCNLANSGSSAFGAIRVMGHHCRIERVKAVNWGTKSVTTPCYVIAVVTAAPASNVTEVVDSGILDCTVVQPGTSISGGKVTLLHAGARNDVATDVEGYGLAPFIRQCFVDCLPASGTPDLTYDYRGISMGWCRGGVVEGNQIHNMKIGGPYYKGGTIRDLIVRNNTYRNVVRGPFWDMGTVYPTTPVSLSGLDRDLTFDSSGKTAVATTNASASVAHGYQPGDRVLIDTAGASNAYEGTFVIKDVPAPNKFRYVMASNPGAAASTPTHQKVFGIGRLIVEGNAIALTTSGASFAIHAYDQKVMEDVPTDIFGDVIVRNNKIRYVDGAYDAGYAGDGILISGATNALVFDNVVEIAPSSPDPVRMIRCRNAKSQNNRKPSGVLVQGYDITKSKKFDELETDAEDAFVMAMFNER